MINKSLNREVAAQMAAALLRPSALERLGVDAPSGQLEDAAARVLTRSAPLRSTRVWAGAMGLVTAVLAMPETQSLLMALLTTYAPVQWLPVLSALTTAALALLSRARDPRPTDV